MNTIVRAFALALVLTGAVASTHIASASSQPAVFARMSATPIPVCAPGGADGCGIGSSTK